MSKHTTHLGTHWIESIEISCSCNSGKWVEMWNHQPTPLELSQFRGRAEHHQQCPSPHRPYDWCQQCITDHRIVLANRQNTVPQNREDKETP